MTTQASRRAFLAGGTAAAAAQTTALSVRADAQADAALWAALDAYKAADAVLDRAGVLSDEALKRYVALGGRPAFDEAFFPRDNDVDLRFYADGQRQGRHSYTDSFVRYLRRPCIRYVEERRPLTEADGATPDQIARGEVFVSSRREPWPDAQARADEIVAAYDRQRAEDARREEASGYTAAQAEWDRAFAETSHAGQVVVTTPARTMAGVLAKVALVADLYDGNSAEYLEAYLTEGGRDQHFSASIVHDLMLMARSA